MPLLSIATWVTPHSLSQSGSASTSSVKVPKVRVSVVTFSPARLLGACMPARRSEDKQPGEDAGEWPALWPDRQSKGWSVDQPQAQALDRGGNGSSPGRHAPARELDHLECYQGDNRSLIQNATGAGSLPRHRERADDQDQQTRTPPARAPGAGWRSSGPAIARPAGLKERVSWTNS